MAIDPKSIRRAMMVAKDIAASVSNVPLMKAKGGSIKTVESPDRQRNLAEFMRGAHPALLNKDGTPKILYHGTSEDFSTFKPSNYLGNVHGVGGVYLTSDPDRASEYSSHHGDTGRNVMPVHVNMKNAYVLKKGEYGADAEKLKAQGYDGIIDGDTFVPFSPHQIKSAVGNRGTFDPSSPDITKDKGGEVDGHPDQGYAPKPAGVLKVDNPGGDWLKENREYSENRGYLPSGAPKFFGKVTAVWRHPKTNETAPVYLPVSMLSKIPGVMSEQENVRSNDLDWLVKSMRETGKLPKFKDDEYKPFITIDHHGRPFVSEGNHRIMAAAKLGWDYLPVEVRYFNGAEDVDGPLHPDRIRAMQPQSFAKADGGDVEAAGMGINVRSDKNAGIRYADEIVDGNKKYETRDSDSLRPYVGKRVAIVRTGEGPAKAIGEVTVGEPVVADQATFHKMRPHHLVPAGSAFDIKPGSQKYLYPMHNPVRFDTEKNVGAGIIARKVMSKATGGTVDDEKSIRRALMAAKSIGGSNSETKQNTITPTHSEARTETGELQEPRGIRGGTGVLQASLQADPSAPLANFPADIAIPSTGQIIKAGPNPLIRQVASEYMRSIGRPYRPATSYVKVSPPRSTRIAKAYDEMKHDPQNPLVNASYNQMLKETIAQYEAAKAAGFKAEFWNPETQEDPYGPSPRLAIEDVNKNHHMFVFPTRAGFGSDEEMAAELHKNPLLADSGERWNGQPVTYNDIFRAVHDYYGHAKEGVGFRADGEENAWRSHAAMYSPLARLAMTSETRGQNSWVNYGPHGEHNRKAKTEDTIFADQKNGILPAWVMHEGAEDFLHPDDVLETYKIYNRKRRADGGGLIEDDQPVVSKDPDLFDMSMLHETPKVAQFDLPRYMPPRGVPERVADITKSRKVANRLADVIQSGLDMGGARWYNAEPLRKEFMKYHGQDLGNRMFRKYMDMVAATSPRSEVSQNVRNASYYYQRLASGQPVPEVGEKNPQPYGHLAQRLHQLNAQRVAGAGWDPLNNPKPASFVENLTGNQSPVTVDTHAFRLPAILAEDPRFIETAYKPSKEADPQNIRKLVESGELSLKDALKTPAYWNAAPKETEYGAMEQMYKKVAQKMGITPAAAQAAAWVGGGKLTGLASDESKPFMRFVQDRIYNTARAKNMDPQDVLKKFVKGEMSLYSDGGSVDAALKIAAGTRKK